MVIDIARICQEHPLTDLSGSCDYIARRVALCISRRLWRPDASRVAIAVSRQFGVLLLLAIAVQCLPVARFRAAVAGGAIAVFALSMAHDAKWLLYDGLVTSDLLRQTRAALLADPKPKVVELKNPRQQPAAFPELLSWRARHEQRSNGAARRLDAAVVYLH